jgi:hypothetical protein
MPAIERTNEVKIHRESGNKTIVTVETTAIERATAIVERTACTYKNQTENTNCNIPRNVTSVERATCTTQKTHTHTHTHKK